MRPLHLTGMVALIGLFTALPAAAEQAVAKATLRNPTSQSATQAPVTFGQVFKKGDIKDGLLVSAAGAAVQADVKRKYDDGSARFAVVSLITPLGAGGELVVGLSDGAPEPLAKPAPVRPAELLKTDFDATVKLTFPPGAGQAEAIEKTASARALLERLGEAAPTWLSGPVCTEWLLEGDLLDKDSKADPDLHVQFHVRAYAGCRFVRVCVVVENCWDTWAGNIGYDVAVTLGKAGQIAYTRKDVNHRRLSRWRKDFWWPAAPPEVDVVHDLAYMSASGALPNYDRSIQVSQAELAKMASGWAGSKENDIMGSGSLTKYMPTTGGRPEIGPYPAWTVQCLLSMNRRAKTVVLGNGDLAGSWPIHVRSHKTGRILTLDERPNFWLTGYREGDDRPKWQADRKAPPTGQTPEAKAYALTPDVAHMPSLAYVPYLVTGDYYHLQEACFWANFCLLAQWHVPRQGAKGIMSDQVRGNAWGLRNIADAAFIAPDGQPEAKYFDEKIRNNLADMIAKMYGPPEYNRLGFWQPRDTNDARIQNPANPDWCIMVPWEHDYLIWSLHHLAELGWTDAAKPRDFEMRWRVGMFVNKPDFDPRLGAPYRFVCGQRGPDKKIVFYEDWKKLNDENLLLGNKPELPRYGGSYSYSARMAVVCGADGGFPKADEALKLIEQELLPDWKKQLTIDPVFGLVPREKKLTTATDRSPP